MAEMTFNATYIPAGATAVTPSCPTCCTHDHRTTRESNPRNTRLTKEINMIRAKFRCTAVTFRGDHTDPNTPRSYELSAVYDQDTPENRRFAKATPWGNIQMQVDNPHARLQVGESYYLDFTNCSEAYALPEDTVEDHSRDVADPATMGNTHDVTEGGRHVYTDGPN